MKGILETQCFKLIKTKTEYMGSNSSDKKINRMDRSETCFRNVCSMKISLNMIKKRPLKWREVFSTLCDCHV